MKSHNPGPAPISITERFWKHVDKRGPDECWLWLGTKNLFGYGYLWSNELKRNVQAHRVAYLIKTGNYPTDYACHTCDTPSCVNPNHIFNGTAHDNSIDMMKKGRQVNQYKNRTSCSAGHEYTEKSTYITRAGTRVCKICRSRRYKKFSEKRKLMQGHR